MNNVINIKEINNKSCTHIGVLHVHLNCFKIEPYLNLIWNLEFKTWFEIRIEIWNQKIKRKRRKPYLGRNATSRPIVLLPPLCTPHTLRLRHVGPVCRQSIDLVRTWPFCLRSLASGAALSGSSSELNCRRHPRNRSPVSTSPIYWLPRRGFLPLLYKCTHQLPCFMVHCREVRVQHREESISHGWVAHTPSSGSRSRVWEHHKAQWRPYRGHRDSGRGGFTVNRSP
jgi:hypothetical protein